MRFIFRMKNGQDVTITMQLLNSDMTVKVVPWFPTGQ